MIVLQSKVFSHCKLFSNVRPCQIFNFKLSSKVALQIALDENFLKTKHENLCFLSKQKMWGLCHPQSIFHLKKVYTGMDFDDDQTPHSHAYSSCNALISVVYMPKNRNKVFHYVLYGCSWKVGFIFLVKVGIWPFVLSDTCAFIFRYQPHELQGTSLGCRSAQLSLVLNVKQATWSSRM